MPDKASASAPSPALEELHALRDKNAFAALGRAVSYLMTKPSFAELKFGFWSRTLTGQINRKHYFFVTNGRSVVGFAGWAFLDEDKARAWLEHNADLGSADCVSGDCMVVNAWAADTPRINRFVLRELRKYAVGKKAAYAKRFYSQGRVRPLQLTLTDALGSHVENAS